MTDEVQLAALVGLAWEHRHNPAELREHIAAIIDWRDRRHVRRFERRQRSTAAVLQVLRETDPGPARSRRPAA